MSSKVFYWNDKAIWQNKNERIIVTFYNWLRTDFLIKVQILLDKAVSNKSQRFLELQRSTYETVVFEFCYSVNYRIIELVFDGDTVSNDL